MAERVYVEFDDVWYGMQEWIGQMQDAKYIGNIVSFAKELGEEIRENIRKHILANDLNWAPLKPSTVEKKGHADPYIETGFYLQNIEVVVGMESETDVVLRISPSGTHPSGKSLQDIAEILELGAPNLQSRPLWRPVQNEMWNYPMMQKINPYSFLKV